LDLICFIWEFSSPTTSAVTRLREMALSALHGVAASLLSQGIAHHAVRSDLSLLSKKPTFSFVVVVPSFYEFKCQSSRGVHTIPSLFANWRSNARLRWHSDCRRGGLLMSPARSPRKVFLRGCSGLQLSRCHGTMASGVTLLCSPFRFVLALSADGNADSGHGRQRKPGP
jgi:hypothetical protein